MPIRNSWQKLLRLGTKKRLNKWSRLSNLLFKLVAIKVNRQNKKKIFSNRIPIWKWPARFNISQVLKQFQSKAIHIHIWHPKLHRGHSGRTGYNKIRSLKKHITSNWQWNPHHKLIQVSAIYRRMFPMSHPSRVSQILKVHPLGPIASKPSNLNILKWLKIYVVCFLNPNLKLLYKKCIKLYPEIFKIRQLGQVIKSLQNN